MLFILGTLDIQLCFLGYMAHTNKTQYNMAHLKATLPLPVRGGTQVRDNSWNLQSKVSDGGLLISLTYGSEL